MTEKIVRYAMPAHPDEQLLKSLAFYDYWYNFFRNAAIKSFYYRNLIIPVEPVKPVILQPVDKPRESEEDTDG
jgi:hypothetical protein